MSDRATTFVAQPFESAAATARVTDQDSAATTIAAGSDAATLPQATVYVASTAALTASGVVMIATSLGNEYITYTGVVGGGTPNLTGCTGGFGKMTTGGAVTQVRRDRVRRVRPIDRSRREYAVAREAHRCRLLRDHVHRNRDRDARLDGIDRAGGGARVRVDDNHARVRSHVDSCISARARDHVCVPPGRD
jgi:hypothetical protein